MWIVEIISPSGVRSYVTVTASSQAEARRIVGEGSEQGFFTNVVVPATEAGLKTLQNQGGQFFGSISDIPSFDAPAPPDIDAGPPGGGGALPPVDTGAAGAGQAGTSTPILGSEQFEFGPAFEAGLRDRGINIGGGGGVTGRLARESFQPNVSRAFANVAFNDPTLTRDPSLSLEEQRGAVAGGDLFQNRIRTGNLFGAGSAAEARGLLNQARGFGSNFGAVNDLAGGILNPATSGQGQDLARIAREAGRQRFGSFARFLPSAGALSQSFLAQPSGGGALTFADFLNQRIFG